MGQRQALLLATFLTTFGLILIGAVAFRLTGAATPDESAVVAESNSEVLSSTESTTATVLNPDQQAVDDLVASRQAAYEAALTQANAQLQAANEQLAQLQSGLVAPAASDSNTDPISNGASAPTFAVSEESASQIALAAAPNTTITADPFLVDFQGIVAYEIATSGGLLYIDATTGSVLFNGAVPATQSAAPAPNVSTGTTTTAPPAAPTAIPAPAAPQAPAPAAPMSEAQALAIAESAVGPGTIDKIKLEEEHGVLIWDVKFTNDNEVRIDAYTGAILRTRIENDND